MITHMLTLENEGSVLIENKFSPIWELIKILPVQIVYTIYLVSAVQGRTTRWCFHFWNQN